MRNFLKDNISKLRKSRNLTQAEAASHLGLKRNTFANYESGHTQPDIDTLVKIASFFGISIESLITSELVDGKVISVEGGSDFTVNGKVNGKPIGKLKADSERISAESEPYHKSQIPAVITVDSDGNEAIVHVPVKARAGYLVGYGDREYIGGLQTYSLPGFRGKTYRSFEVEGVSMKPTLQPRDWVVGEWLESLSDIRENRVHIIVTKNDGILIKRVLNRISERGKLYLKSDTIHNRHDYPTIELDPSDIAEIWYARVRFGSDFSEPSEIFRRIDDLEIEMIELKKRLP